MCDTNGNQHVLVDRIINHQKDGHAVHKDDAYTIIQGRCHRKKITRSWKFCCQWKGVTTSWARLADLKECNPVEAAGYLLTPLLRIVSGYRSCRHLYPCIQIRLPRRRIIQHIFICQRQSNIGVNTDFGTVIQMEFLCQFILGWSKCFLLMPLHVGHFPL